MMTQKKLNAGVVWGDDYKTLVQSCKAGKYALPAVNVADSNGLSAVLEAAKNNNADVIIQVSNGGAHFFGGAPLESSIENKVRGAVLFAQHAHMMAEHYGVCVVLHTDHANRALLPWIDGLIEASAKNIKDNGYPLFSSHMIDLSEEDINDNITTCKAYMGKLAPLGISLEMELGCTGGEEDGIGGDYIEEADNSHLYTQPQDVLQAYDILSPLGHVSIAASFGNVHGVYKPGNVKLSPEILRDSQTLVSAERGLEGNPLDFVFHGGSGSEKSKITESLGYGVFKMNIDTDTQFAFANGVYDYINDKPVAFQHQIDPETGEPYKKIYDPRKWLRAGQKSIASRLDEAFEDLGAQGKSIAR